MSDFSDRMLAELLKGYLEKVFEKLDEIKYQGGRILATVQDLTTKIADIETAISEERTEVQALLDGLRAQIQVLQDQIGQGQLVTQEQLDGLAASADAIVLRVRAISEPVPALA